MIPPQLSTDKKGSGSLVDTTVGVYGTLDQSQNHIHYPNSKFDNIRNNMGKGSGSSATSTSSHKTTTTTHKSTTTTRKTTTTSHSATPTSSGQCSGVAAWNADTEYKPNAKVTYSKCLIVRSGRAENLRSGQMATSGPRAITRTTTSPGTMVRRSFYSLVLVLMLISVAGISTDKGKC